MRRCALVLVCLAVSTAACEPRVYVGYDEAPLDVGDAGDAGSEPILPWQAHHEDGTLSEWLGDGFGDLGSEETAELTVSSEYAHGGSYALEVTISSSGDPMLDQAVIWRNVRLESGIYSAWYYFPDAVITDNWVIMKLSSQHAGDRFDIDVQSIEGEGPRLRIYEHDDGWITERSNLPVPVRTWVHVEAEFVAHPSNGRLIVRQDGVEVFDIGPRFTLPDNALQFFVGSASFSVEPVPARVFIDDVGIFPTAP